MKKSQLPAFDINKVTIGTRVVTRDRHLGRINSIDLEKLDYPISAIIDLDGKENTLIFTKEGRFYSDDKDSMFDLFLEEEKIENQKPIQPEKQDKHEVNCLQSKDNISNGAIVFEDFNGDDGFYKVHLDYLNKEQVEVIETLVEAWNKEKKELNKINKEDKELKQINKEVKTRLMTEQELSDWLCQCPEEHREMKYKNCATIYKYHSYYENEANTPIDDVLIRKNHGEWKEPLINN